MGTLATGAVASSSVSMSPQETGPTAEFTTSPSEPLPDEDVTFDASNSTEGDTEIVDYEWYIPDGDANTHRSGESITDSFSSHGEFDVELEVTDENGNTDSITQTISVGGENPTAAFNISPTEPNPDEEITFDATESSAPDGDIVEYDWYIPDGEARTHPSGETIVDSFSDHGAFDVELEITDNGGKTDSVTKTVTVGGEGPTAEFSTSPTEPDPNEEITFDATESSAPDSDIVEYNWYIPDGEARTHPSGETVSDSFSDHGEFDVELEVIDNGGKTDSKTKTVEVGGDGPTAEFAVSPSQPTPNQEVTFDASGSDAASGEIVSYEWTYERDQWRDGSASGETFSHAFGSYDEYEVTLEVHDSGGMTDTTTQTVTVDGEGPTADFEYSPANPELNERVVFDGSSSSGTELDIETYRWFINGDERRGDVEMANTFSESGVYNIELEVEDAGGKTDRLTKTLAVGDDAEIIDNPDFELRRSSPSDELVAVGPDETVSFVSEIDAEELPEATNSLFVNGELSTQSDVESTTLRETHQFETLGDHTVEMELKGDAGQSDVVEWDIRVHTFNSLPTIAEQSSSTQLSLDGNTELLTFSVQNPSLNDNDILAEIVTEPPDGVSISGASGVSSGDAAIQASSETIRPGEQESMRLEIAVDDESLDGQRLQIPYEVRYQPHDGESVIYTDQEGVLEVTVGSERADEPIDDESPGFGIIAVVASLLIGSLLVSRYRY